MTGNGGLSLRKRVTLAAVIGVLAGIFACTSPAAASHHPGPWHPDSGTLTWVHPEDC